ncbi:MFS transporter [Robbsia sp. Bb-Pol-6]|uniref:MFS transporter n=1 Tax=Robbsia betulipollinis TaxID=2981849 RepID=A0ABT3ZS91_9BURK|nr:MFS transporter [Robbsia betulipollinis]MCY0389431.1 MFS transporter [Robbsia betulipollinis]
MDAKWTSTQRNVVIAAVGSWTLDAFDFFLLVFLLSDIAKTYSVGIPRVTLAILLTLAVRPVGALLFGRAAEKYGRRPVLMANILVFSVLELASGFAPTLTVFLILRVLYGVAMGGVWGVASSLAMETVPPRSRGLVSGLFQAGYPFGYLIASVVYGALVSAVGWRGLFMIGALPVLMIVFIWFKVPESPVWLTARERKHDTALWPILRREWKLGVYAVLLMACFNFFSHGTQDLYPTFLKVQHHFDPHTVSIIAITYNIAAMIGGITFGTMSERIGRRKAIIIAVLLSLPVLPLWAFSQSSLMIGVGAFLMQFMVQGAWGVIPAYLNELAPEGTRAVLPGFVYQLGNLLASVNATLQAVLAERHGGNYGFAMACVAGTVAVLIAVFVYFGRDTQGQRFEVDESLVGRDATARRSL